MWYPLLLPPPASRANQLPPTNCHQQIVTNQCQQPIATHELSPTNCHPPITTNHLSPTSCHQPTVINELLHNQLSTTNCHQLTNQLSPTDCHQPLLPMMCLPLVFSRASDVRPGAGWRCWVSPLFRCDLRARCSKTLCFTVFFGRGRSTIWTPVKCKNCGFYKGGVGNARCPRVHNRNFLSHGPVSMQMAQNIPQDEPTEAPR